MTKQIYKPVIIILTMILLIGCNETLQIVEIPSQESMNDISLLDEKEIDFEEKIIEPGDTIKITMIPIEITFDYEKAKNSYNDYCKINNIPDNDLPNFDEDGNRIYYRIYMVNELWKYIFYINGKSSLAYNDSTEIDWESVIIPRTNNDNIIYFENEYKFVPCKWRYYNMSQSVMIYNSKQIDLVKDAIPKIKDAINNKTFIEITLYRKQHPNGNSLISIKFL